MTAFQFDECFNDKELIARCNESTPGSAWYFPKRLLQCDDSEVLEDLLARSNPLVTLDHEIVDDHPSSIPATFPGIVIVREEVNDPRRLSTIRAAKVLAAFKLRFVDWKQVVLGNSIIEICGTSLKVGRFDGRRVVFEPSLSFDESDWEQRMLTALRANSTLGINDAGDMENS